MLVTYGGTCVLIKKDDLEGDDIYLHRIWSIAETIENKRFEDLQFTINLSKLNAYKRVTGVTYSETIEKQISKMFN